MIRVATAFSGGLAAPEFALKYSGIEHEIVFACEWDKYAIKQYLQFHGKPTTFYEDIKNLCAKCYYALIDLFIFGSPCQNLSLAGNKKGLEGEKSKYFFEGYRVLSELMPKVFIFENVKGLLSSNKGKDFALVMKMFRDLGYHCAHTVLNTKDYGVPQNRERVFVVGFLDVNAYHDFNFLPGFPLEKRLRDVLESDVDEKYYINRELLDYKSQSNSVYDSNSLAPALCAGTHGYALGYVQTDVVGMLDMPGHDCIRRVYGVNGVAPTLSTMQGGSQEPKILQLGRGFNNGGEHEICPTLTINSFEQNNFVKEPMIRQKSQSGIRYREDCGTLSASANRNDMCVVNDYSIRRLTPRECFRLQGVRDEDINIVVSDTQAYKIAGNAMSVPPLEMLITQIFRPQRISSLFGYSA